MLFDPGFTMSTTAPAPRWMTNLLYVAAAYNIVWGLAAILFPLQLFALAGMPAPNYPSLAQCIGMIVGVYGVGYALAARDPVTHWPIVLVGLLGKLFGPIGFVWAATNGEFPWIAGLTILTNDVAWWLPFSAILIYAAREHDARRLAALIGPLDAELARGLTDRGDNLLERSRERPQLLMFIRHSGCTFCREMLADLRQQLPTIRQQGLEPVVVQMGSRETGRKLLDSFGLNDVAVVADPERRLYRACELPLGTLTQIAGPYVIARALSSGSLFRYGIGRMVGNGLQLAGACVIEHGRITRAYRHQTTADRPSYAALACAQ
jgi:peroxiredoxin